MATDSEGPEEAGDDPALFDTLSLESDFPDFEILEMLGQGGMGVVYKARDRKLERLVALKIMTAGLSKQSRFVERFEREGKALARVHHPNIVTLYDFGKTGTRCFMVMEYVEGTNLRHVMQAGVSPREALAIVAQICAALQYAHNANVVHRDIKPENILIGTNGQIKITDFGLAKLLPAGGEQGLPEGSLTIIGTPAYMAPEQIENPSSVDHRADVYALGVVFYELLTGERPHGVFKPPSQQVAVDVRLDAVVLRALERKPELRYQQVSEMGSSIEALQGAASAPTACPLERRWRVNWRSRRFYVGIAAGVLLGLLLHVVLNSRTMISYPAGNAVAMMVGGENAQVKSLHNRVRELVVSYRLGFDSVFPNNPWNHRDKDQLSLYPDGSWPEILGPIGPGSAPGKYSLSAFTVLTEKDKNLKVPKVTGLVAYQPQLNWPIVADGYCSVLCLNGIGESGSIVAQSYALLAVNGNMEGRMVVSSYATVVIDGNLSGSLTHSSYMNLMITGNLEGRIQSDSYVMIYVQGQLNGRVELSKGGRLYVESYTPQSSLQRVSGNGSVYLAGSDLGEGDHKIGQLKVTVGRQKAEKAP